MAITKSAKKALRQGARRKARNIQRKHVLKSLIKQGKKLVAQKNFAEAQKLLPQLYKALDKAAQRNVIKKNAAARKKSQLAKLFKTNSPVGQ